MVLLVAETGLQAFCMEPFTTALGMTERKAAKWCRGALRAMKNPNTHMYSSLSVPHFPSFSPVPTRPSSPLCFAGAVLTSAFKAILCMRGSPGDSLSCGKHTNERPNKRTKLTNSVRVCEEVTRSIQPNPAKENGECEEWECRI